MFAFAGTQPAMRTDIRMTTLIFIVRGIYHHLDDLSNVALRTGTVSSSWNPSSQPAGTRRDLPGLRLPWHPAHPSLRIDDLQTRPRVGVVGGCFPPPCTECGRWPGGQAGTLFTYSFFLKKAETTPHHSHPGFGCGPKAGSHIALSMVPVLALQTAEGGPNPDAPAAVKTISPQ
jgi:hypothetical protein